ncbi:hypothetical protein BGW38_005699, partial [Lunasporangiospora selenospora]
MDRGRREDYSSQRCSAGRINVSDNNFDSIFPKDYVEFIDRLKNARKLSADDED